MDEEVLNDLYNRAVSQGYTKSIEEFAKLIKNDNDVFNDMYSYVKSKGYKKDQNSFGLLVGRGSQTYNIQEQDLSTKKVGPAPQVPRGSGVSISEGGTSGLETTTSDYLTFQTGEEGLGQPKTNVEIPLAPGGPQPKKKAPQVQKKEEESAFLPTPGGEFKNLRIPTEEELSQEEKKDIKEGKAIKIGNKIVYPSGTKKEKIKAEGAEFYPETFTKESPLGNTSKEAQDPINIEREKSLKTVLNSFDEFKLSTGKQQLNEDDEAKNFYLYYLQKNNPDQYKFESERINYNKDNPLESQKIQVELINKGLALKQQAISAKAEEINNVLSDKFLGYDEDTNKLKDVNSQINSIVPKIEEINKELYSYPKDQNGNIIVNETNKRKVEKLTSEYKNEYKKYESLIGQRDELLNSDFGTLIKKADELGQEQKKNYEYAKNLEKYIKESDKFPELKKELINEALKTEIEKKAWEKIPDWMKPAIDIASGFKRAGTGFAKGILFLPKLAGEKAGYGWTDKFADWSDGVISEHERWTAPISPDAKKDIFDYERDENGNPKLNENGEKIEKTNWKALPYQLSYGAGNMALFFLPGVGFAGETANILSKVGLTANTLSKVGTFAVGYTLAAKGNYDDAKAAGMSETDALTYARYKSPLDAAVELIFPEEKLLTSTATKNAATKLSAKYLSKGVPIKDAIVKGTVETLKKVGGENVEELTATITDYMSKLVAEKATGADFKVDDNIMNQIKSTVLITSIITAPFGLVGAKGKKNEIQNQSLFLAANKPTEMLNSINELLDAKVITEDQANIARQRIEIAAEQLKTIPQEYSDDKKSTALALLVDKKMLEDKKKEINPVFHQNIDNQIKEKEDELSKDVNRDDNGLSLEQNDELEDLTFKKDNGVITETEQKKLDELNKFVEDYKKPKEQPKTRTVVAVEIVPEGQRFPMVTEIPKEELETFRQQNPTANVLYEKEIEVKEEVGKETKVEQEIKKQENAIQEQTTGQVPIQPETKIGGEMEERKPQAEPEIFTEEGEAKPKEEVKVEEKPKEYEQGITQEERVGKPGEEIQGVEIKTTPKRTTEFRAPKSKTKIKDKRLSKALSRIPNSPYEIVLQAILKGTKFNTSAFQELFGNKRDLAFGGKISKKALSEARSRFGLWNNKIGYSIKELAEDLWEGSEYYQSGKYDDTDFRNAIEEVLLGHTGTQSILNYFDDLYKKEDAGFDLTEEESEIASFYNQYGIHPDELNDYWNSLTEEEQSALANENIVPNNFIPYVEEELESYGEKKEAVPTAEEKTIKQKAEELNKKIDAVADKIKNTIVDKNTNNRLFSAPVVTPKMISDLIDLSTAVIKKSISGGATIAQAVNDGINAIKNHPRYKRFIESGQINEENFEKQIRDSWDGLIKDEEALAQEEIKKKEEEAKKEVPPAKPPVTTEAEKGPAPEGKKERATATRILENKKFHEDVVKRLSNEAIFYEPTSVKKSEEFVNAVIDEYETNGRLDDLVNEYMADKSDVIPDNQKLLFGDLLTKRLEDIASKEENEFVRETLFDKAEQVFEKTAKNTTTAAQQLALIRNRDTRMFSNEIYMRRYAKKQFSEMQDNAMSEAQKNDIKSAQEIIDEYRKSNEFAKEVEQATAEELKKIAETREGAGKVKQFNDIIDSLKVNLSDC